MNFGVTGIAEGHEVLVSVGTAPINWEHMVDNIGGDEAVSFEALRAERMPSDISLTNNAPAVIVVLGIAVSAIILAGSDGLVVSAIAAFPDGLGAAGIGAGLEGKLGHRQNPPSWV